MNTIDRILAKVRADGECLVWQGAKSRGYGYIAHEGKMVGVHRLAWAAANGQLIDGLVIDHICHNKLCVNSAHLRQVTKQENNEYKAGPYQNNKSGVRGVCWAERQGKWKVQVCVRGKKHHGGYFADLNEAAEVARQMRILLHANNEVDLTTVHIMR